MNRRLVVVFAFALAVAGLTSFAAYRMLIKQVRTPARSAPVSKVMVAAHDLQVGALIHDFDLTQVSWSGPVPQHAMQSKQDVLGRGVIANIYQGEPILEFRLAPKGAGAGLAATIPVGKRAVALRVNEVVGLAGFVLPGMRVDVLIAGTTPANQVQNQTGTLCRTVLQNIEVLSAGQRIEKNVEGKPESVQVVNLLVSPDQAEILSLASDETKVQLVLRNPLDTEEQVTQGTSVAALFGQSVKTVPAAPMRSAIAAAPRPLVAASHRTETTVVEVFSGVRRSEQKFELPNGR
jgi:pilus assembly protein CpaB